MVNYYIYAKDNSYSTYNVAFYHQNGLKTIENFKSDMNNIISELAEPEETKIIYLHWGHECKEVNEHVCVEAYETRNGNGGGTFPETIIEWIKENIDSNGKIKLLYIITDGEISSVCVHKCSELNEDVHYEKVVFHAISEDLSCIDLSVAASFIKGQCTIYRNSELFDETDVSKEFDYDIITIENFSTEKDNLKSYIKFKFLNMTKNSNSALTEIEKLKNLKTRLFKSLSSKGKCETLTIDIRDTKYKYLFIREFKNTIWYQSFDKPSYNLKVDIEKSITTLINYIVNDKKSYDFDNLKFETAFSTIVPEEPIVDVEFTTEQEIEFPDIILADEKGIPVILLTETNLLDKIIFQSSEYQQTSELTASFSKFNTLMECPLFLSNDPDVKESIGYFYTINAYKQLLEQSLKLEPRSRRPFHGGLVLVDIDDYDKYNDYILSATYFNSKKVKYNVGLFYFLLWKICESKEWMDRNVVEQFKKYMLRRVTTTICKIGLSSLPLDPQVNTSLDTALWYCVEISSHIFKDDPQRFSQERLRKYYGIAHFMIEILKYLNYKLNLTFINKRKDLIRNVAVLKKIPMWRDKVLYMVEKVFKNVNGFLICDIENPKNVLKLNYLKYNHKEMLSDEVMEEEVKFKEYVNFLHHTDVSGVQICEKTFRPYFVIDEEKSFYTELIKMAKQVVVSKVGSKHVLNYSEVYNLEFGKILSYYNLFLHYVRTSNKFPTLQEYIEYIKMKKKFTRQLVTIFPVNVCEEIEKVYSCYQNLVKDVSVNDFVEAYNKYVNRFERIKAENKRPYDSDHQIMEFITKEEFYVSLVKAKPLKKKPRLSTVIKTNTKNTKTTKQTRRK